MAYPSVTYTFTNGTTASATEVNQNFTDLINGLSNGTKDLSISALTVAGTATLNGAVNIGNATGDDVAVNGYITTAISPKTANSYDFGDATQTWRSGYFATSLLTPLIKAIDGNGIKFQENGGTEVMSISDAGVVTVGPDTTYNAPLKTAVVTSGGKCTVAKGGAAVNIAAGASVNFSVCDASNSAGCSVLITYGDASSAGCGLLICGFSSQVLIISQTTTSNKLVVGAPAANQYGLAFNSSTGILTVTTNATMPNSPKIDVISIGTTGI
jgi:hypothetical protein